jgi:tetratricopeptide (TPR) repeat protein
VPAPAAERAASAAALAPLPRDPLGAERRLAQFLQSYPDSSLADDAGLELGRIALARGDKEAALTRFRVVVESRPDGDRTDSARVELAQLEAARGRREVAASELGRARLSKLPAGERRVAYRVLAEVASDPVASLRWRARLRAEETDPEEVARIDAELNRAIDGLSAEDLDRAAEQLGDQIPAARVLARRADLALAQGDLETARRAFEAARRRELTASDATRVAALGERIERSGRRPSTPPTCRASSRRRRRHLPTPRRRRARSASYCRSRGPSRASARRACTASCWPQTCSAARQPPARGRA